MERNNNLSDEDVWNPVDSSQLSYEENVEVGKSVSMATDNHSQRGSQHISNEAPVLKSTSKPQSEGVNNNNTNICLLQNVIDIKLPYDVNQVTEQDSWDRNFHFILLHGTLKYLLSNSKNIKEFLHCMTKYI